MSGTRNIYYSLLTCAAVALGLTPAAADAATAGDIPLTQVLNTSPLWADSVSYHECIVVNITTGAVTVSGELISSTAPWLTALVLFRYQRVLRIGLVMLTVLVVQLIWILALPFLDERQCGSHSRERNYLCSIAQW